jgi:hypothetical protein
MRLFLSGLLIILSAISIPHSVKALTLAGGSFVSRKIANPVFPSKSPLRHFATTLIRERKATLSSLFSSESGDDEVPKSSSIEIELESLQHNFSLIEALEARNEAQLDSFVDKEDQWNSLEEEERILLESKELLVQRMEILAEKLVQLWMGQKSMDG